MLRPEPLDIIIILFIAFLFFGGIKRMPDTTRAIGKAIREFRIGLAQKDDKPPAEPKNGEA